MPYDERRRSTKIVEAKTSNHEQELIGGLQNALSRGETIAKAKQSFISAGYKPQEIETAAKKISITPRATQQTPATKQQPTQTPQQPIPSTKPEKKDLKFLLIIIPIIIILVGAGLLGLFWNKIFT